LQYFENLFLILIINQIIMFKKLLLVLFICSSFIAQSQIVNQPKIQREFRAAWIASVANINWPSKPGLTTQQQQDEAIALLDMLQKNNFNAVIFQIRPQADAFYKSDIEPWSYYLTGVQGQAPNPYYDPLEFWVNAAHERGMELHVWLNPYRAHHIAGGEVSEFSVVKKHPDLVVKLKQGYWWFDPSKKGTQDLASSVVKDIVKRYDIDGVHFDDYFYPYAEYNGGDDFPDEESYANYQKDGGKLSRGDWRREQVNKFVKRVYSEIKKEKKHVKFGISPFGIWRPGYPESIKGMDQYEKLYADAKLWLNKGWIDYFMPQLYWQINNIPLSFPVLLGWWQTENTKNRHLWPGLNSGIGGGEKNSDEIINQIMIARGIVPNSPGVAHWSIGALTKHESLRNDLLAGPYKEEALIPTSPWLDKKAPAAVSVDKEDRNTDLYIKWTAKDEKDVFKYVVYTQYGDRWTYRTLNSKSSFFQVPKVAEVNAKTKATAPLKAIKVTAVDRTGNESEGEVIAL
jgi:uncharacterized lipoprotein YddW (UPF0748 family)